MKFFGIIFISIFVFIACEESNLNSHNVKIENLKRDEYKCEFDSAFILKQKIILKASNNYILSSIKQICVRENKIVVLDSRGKQVLVFDRQGKFLSAIGKNGSGPGEFEKPTSIAMSPNGNIIIYDISNLRVTSFSIEGDYLSSFNVKRGLSMTSNSLGELIFFNSGIPKADNLKVVDIYSHTGNFIKSICESFYTIPAMGGNLITTNKNNSLFLIHPSEYKVFKFSDSYLDLMEFASIPRYYKKPENESGRLPTLKELNESTALRGIFANNNYIFINLIRSEPKSNWIDVYNIHCEIIFSGIQVDNNFTPMMIDENNNFYFVKNPEIINNSNDFLLSDYEIYMFNFLEK